MQKIIQETSLSIITEKAAVPLKYYLMGYQFQHP